MSKKTIATLMLATSMTAGSPLIAPPAATASALPEFFCDLAEAAGWQSAGLNFVCYVAMDINGTCCDPYGDPWYESQPLP